jgi:hypothetical protein
MPKQPAFCEVATEFHCWICHSQTIFCHVVLFRVVHSFPRLRGTLHACFSSDFWVMFYILLPDCHRLKTQLSSPVQPDFHCIQYAIVITSTTRLLPLWEPDCHRQHNQIVIAHTTQLLSPVQSDCHCCQNANVIASTTRLSLHSVRDCHRQYNPIVIAFSARLSSLVQPNCHCIQCPIVIASTTRLLPLWEPDCHRQHNHIVIANITQLSSPVQSDCHCYQNAIVIAMQLDCHSQDNPTFIAVRTKLSYPARCLSSPPIECTLHLLRSRGIVRGGQTRVSILAGFKFRLPFLLAANDMGVYEAPSVSHMVCSCAVLTDFVS